MVSEQFSLCWDEFHKNMSSGMTSLLESEDLVDVTIAVEGRHLKAHKMVLSVCSPYFRELFKETPCKHPIVFLKDVSYIVMSELLQFMYQGEVQVSQENLTTFINTAEALQIKGLTEHANGSSERVKEPRQENKVAPERPRVERTSPVSVVKTEPAVVGAATSASSDEHFMQLKTEPYDPDEKFTDDPLEDINEDYSMMGDEETEAGTSADGTTGGQESPKMSDVESSEHLSCTSPEIRAAALTSVSNLLPEKSQDRYNKAYYNFKEWCKAKNVTKISESAILVYFEEKAKIHKSSTLWSIYSMVKTTLRIRDNIDISKYPKLLLFLKRKNVGYKPKKSSVLNINQVNTFLEDARDEEFIPIKVALIMGVAGACRSDELCKMSIHDLQVKDDIITVNVPHTKRQFAIIEPNWIRITKKYVAMRPADQSRFFLSVRNGRVTRQPIGHNMFGSMPKKIASFLKLENPHLFTGHCFRRTSATALTLQGGGVLHLKRYSGWRSPNIAEERVEDSFERRIKIPKMIQLIQIQPETSDIPGISQSTAAINISDEHIDPLMI